MISNTFARRVLNEENRAHVGICLCLQTCIMGLLFFLTNAPSQSKQLGYRFKF